MFAPFRLSLLWFAMALCGGVEEVKGAPIAVEKISAPTDYYARRWLVGDGLPHNTTRRVVQDKRGFLWVATVVGLARFDGREFKLYRPPASDAEFHYNIRDLAIEDDRTLVMLQASGGVTRFRDGEFSEHPVSATLAGKTLINLFVEPEGALWVLANDGTLARWQDGKTELFGPADFELDRSKNFTFARDGHGRTWIANGSYLGWYLDGKLIRGPLPLEAGFVIASSRSGGLWISTVRSLFKMEGETLTVVCEEPLWPALRSGIEELFEDSRGVLWIATRRSGLFRLEGNRIVNTLAFAEVISSVSEDSEKNLWVAMAGGGLTRLRPKTFVTLDVATGLPDKISLSVCDDETGAIWCANRSGGLARSKEGRTTVFKLPDLVNQPYVTSVCPDREGHIWVGAVEGLYEINAGDPDFPHLRPEVAGTVHTLFCTKSGDLWVGAGDNRLGFFHHGAYRALTKVEGFPEQRVSAIAEDVHGVVWICTNRELFEFTEGKFVRRLAREENRAGELLALHVDTRGTLWIGTTNGLLRRQNSNFKLIGMADGLPGDTITQILEDDVGRFWCGGRYGLFSVAAEDLNAFANGLRRQINGIVFGSDEGLTGSSSPRDRQPMAWKGRDGRLWFASSEGLIGIDPGASSGEHRPPRVYIDQVQIDKTPLPPGPLVVPPGRHQVDFNFAALNYSAPEKVRVRHQLVGFDYGWIETTREWRASYVRLPPGHYTMRVDAANQDGLWTDDSAATLAVTVVPAWWQRWWFAAALVLTFTGLIVWAVRFWSHGRLKRRLHDLQREHALEKERARIARDLHDELGGSLTQIRMLADRLKRHAPNAEAQTVAAQLSTRTRRLTGELESIVWTVSPKNNTWDRLAAFIGQYAMRFFRDTPLACTVHGVDAIPTLRLRPEEQHHVLAIAKEAFNNSLKHSQASRVTVTMACEDEVFALEIRDNGIGFDMLNSTVTTRNGLTNMRTRAREIGGRLEIETASAHGTRIALTLSLRAPAATLL